MTGPMYAVQATMDLGLGGPRHDRDTLPVEVLEQDGGGLPWLRLEGEWRRLAHIENLWQLEAIEGGPAPAVGLHFRAVTDDGRTLRLFQDLCRGAWFCRVARGAAPGQIVP